MFTEHLDKLILRIILCGIFLIFFYLCRYIHWFFYPAIRRHIQKEFDLSMNSSHTLHYLSCLIGLGIVFTSIEINFDQGLLLAAAELFFRNILSIVIYFISLFIVESIALYDFNSFHEVVQKKNLSYGIIHFAQSLAIALVISKVFIATGESIAHLALLWLYSMVIFGVAIKFYKYYSKLSFNSLLDQRSTTLAISYSGYIGGCAFLINSTLQEMTMEILSYVQLLILKLLLISLIFPLFIMGIKKVFFLKDYKKLSKDSGFMLEKPVLGYGVYEGILFFSSSIMTVVIIDQVFFGIFYP